MPEICFKSNIGELREYITKIDHELITAEARSWEYLSSLCYFVVLFLIEIFNNKNYVLVRLPRAHSTGAEQAPPRPRAPGGSSGGRDGRAGAGGLNTLCSPSPGSSWASTAPASNFSALSLPSRKTPATKKSSLRGSGDTCRRPSSPRKARTY